MATSTLGTVRPVSEAEILSFVLGEHATAAAGNPNALRVAGKYVAQPTAVDSGDDVVAWRDSRGYVTPHLDSIVTVTVTTGASASTAIGTLLGLSAFRELDVVTEVTQADGAVATLNVLVDSEIATAGSFHNLAQSPAYTAAGVYSVHMTRAFGTNIATSLVSDAGAGSLRQAAWGDRIRIRAVVTGTATTSMSAVIYVSGVV